jgi:putative flippase GtrA
MVNARTTLQNNKEIIRQFFGFAAVGAIGTSGHYAILIGLVHFLGLNPLLASTAGFVVGALVNYLLSYIFIFRSRKRHSEAISKFFVVALVGLGLNSMALSFGVYIAQWNYLVAQLAATAIVLFWNFVVNKIWTFSQPL